MAYAVDVDAFLSAVVSWAKLQFNLNESTTVIRAYQSAQRPARPYAAVSLVSGPNGPSDDDAGFDSNNLWTVSGWREIQVSIDYYGLNAFSQMNQLILSRGDLTLKDSLTMNNIVFVDCGEIRNLSSLENAGFQTRAQCDFTFRVKSLATQAAIGTVASVGLTNELDDSKTKGAIVIVSP
jgi:hypothetical protein